MTHSWWCLYSLYFRTASQVTHTGLILTIYLRMILNSWTSCIPHSECCNYRHALLSSVYEALGIKSRASGMIGKHCTRWTTFLVIVTVLDGEKLILISRCIGIINFFYWKQWFLLSIIVMPTTSDINGLQP